jgi:hypothetical protein
MSIREPGLSPETLIAKGRRRTNLQMLPMRNSWHHPVGWGRYFARLLAVGLVISTTMTVQATDDTELLTPEEITRVDRENALWRLVRADSDLPANLTRLRSKGATTADLAWFAPKLAATWDVSLHREFGWMRPEQIEAIKAVDREFVARLRAARVRRDVGIELDPAHRGEAVLTVLARWQRTLLRTIDYDQLAEFRLMNSGSAEKAARFFENIPLSDDERRTVYEWQRNYDENVVPFTQKAGTLEFRFDHWTRLRDLLGDERMAIYLADSEPGFARMQDALGTEVSAVLALDAWWIFQEHWLEQQRGLAFGDSIGAQQERVRTRLQTRLGAEVWAHYVASSNFPRWLRPMETKRPMPEAK